MGALACGLGALEAARVGAWELALRLILLAAVADGIDGTLARRLGATSRMGEQLDSLADVVAFGVAPAFLFSTYYADAPDPARFGVALTFVGAAAYRLARFNVQPHTGAFCGLPVTAAGPLLAATVAGPFTAGVIEAGVVAVALAVLMVGCHPFPTLAHWRSTLLPALAAAALPVVLWPRVETLAIVAGVILGLYVLWGLLSQLAHSGAHAIDEEVQEPVTPRA